MNRVGRVGVLPTQRGGDRDTRSLPVPGKKRMPPPMTNGKKRILIVDDEPLICENLACLAQREGIVPVVAYDGESALKKIRLESPDVLMVDFKLPDMDGMEVLRRAKALDEDLPVVIITAYAEVHGAVEAMRAAAHDYLAKPFEHHEVIGVMHRALAERNLNLKLKELSSRVHRHMNLLETMGPSDAIGRLIADVNRVAKSNFSVVITGETGTGKELVAQAIHQAGARARAPFVPVDCGAIPETLLEGELFGHEKGAFTGAVCQRAGKIEAAKGGTLFLDEISNLPLGSQAKLLRVLQEKLVYRVGATKPMEVDVRVLVASNNDLEAAVTSNSFRRDLFFRLNEFAIRIPPLRERSEDVLYLAKRFLDITNQELDKQVQGFSPPVIRVLLTYPWPGNVRQLRSTVRRAVLLAEGVVMEKHLDIKKEVIGFGMDAAFNPAGAAAGPPPASLTLPVMMAASLEAQEIPIQDLSLKEIVSSRTVVIEREALCQALKKAAGNKAQAARRLRIDYKTIQSKIKKYGITQNEREPYGEEEQRQRSTQGIRL